MAGESRGRSGPRPIEDESMFGSRSLEAFSRKVTATAGHLLGDITAREQYQQTLGDLHREMRHPLLQRQVFNLAQATPRELVRSKLSPTEIQHRALTYLPDEMLSNIPEHTSSFSLFQGFQASLPEAERYRRRLHARQNSRGQALLDRIDDDPKAPAELKKLRNDKDSLDHRLEMMNVRKNMCSTEIREIDTKISNLNSMRKIVLDRLSDLEQEEAVVEREMLELDNRLEDMREELDDAATLMGQRTPTSGTDATPEQERTGSPGMEASFMSESIYEKIPSPKGKRPKNNRRKTHFILHEHLQAGSSIREFQAHNDVISALDFDVPFGTMVTAALDDTVRVWDLNAGRCMGLLEGHLSSVRCLQVEDNLVATGSMDATVRLWDLSQADYSPPAESKRINKSKQEQADGHSSDEDDLEDFADASEAPPSPPPSNMRDCPVFTLNAHVAEVTALHFHNNTLVSGSADKTLRQWDLEKGRCVQTLDVLWAAAQASSSIAPSGSITNTDPNAWRQASGRLPDASADFVGALQCFDAALACGTADGLVRLWDLRSGQVHRSLIGHTGPVTSLQFDDKFLVTGSLDRSIRIWDLRTGTIFDAYAYDNPVTSMMFDARSIVAAAGEAAVKVYDKAEMKHWDCGSGQQTEQHSNIHSIVEKVRVKDGYLVEGRKDGTVGVWSC